eukprot:CAMPEP_0114529260 /NCGR_PEP_ID=MMETSP0109-20121206/24727_1 /TAXON_ID=29199 /ORGANISM="Chlorarachnion reptans, Strain CCCM449" /LENGTH=513 /DNA_ID=CAMNT_0001711625 /DNA_START=251 /DNA_END=1790 /DNA_ORIENTATION=-
MATKRIRRLKITNPKLFSLAPRGNPKICKGIRGSLNLKPQGDLKRQTCAKPSQTTAHQPRVAPTNSVSKLKRFFDKKREAMEKEVKSRPAASSPAHKFAKFFEQPTSITSKPRKPGKPKRKAPKPTQWSEHTSPSPSQLSRHPEPERTNVPKYPTDASGKEKKSSKDRVPAIVHKAMEFTERRASVTADIELGDLKSQMRAFKKSQAKAIKSAAKDKEVLYDFESKYSIQDEIELGSGLTAVVKLCVDNVTRQEYAVKIISKANSALDVETFRQEIEIMEKMRHPNIIKMIDYFETTDFIYIVQEVAYGGELFDRILEQKQFSEKDAAALTKQMLSALVYMHNKGIVHRDLKPENILYSSFKDDALLKISDFGFASDTSSGAPLTQKLGTQGYCAVTEYYTDSIWTNFVQPEVFSGKPYDSKCDIWSLGVIVYILLSGLPPFIDLDAEDEIEALNQPFWIYVNQMQQVQNEKVAFTAEVWKRISKDAREFLCCALQIDAKERPTANELLNHCW